VHLARHILITSLITVWGIRLGTFFYSRYKKGADPRFITWQQPGGKYAFLVSAFWIFVAQGALALIMAVPAILVNSSTVPGLNWLDLLGLALWVLGFACESIADYQLSAFKKDPANRNAVMNQGLWHYSRHPNYFGEMVMWWAIFLIALSVPNGIYAIIAPLTITILLRFFTGVPLIERTFKGDPAYEAYKKKTNMLIPWWPKA
jgi:steroid 5-alpha reductase family enzyme